MFEFVAANKEWIFSGVGISVVLLLVFLGRKLLAALRPNGPTVKVSLAMARVGVGNVAEFLVITAENHTDQPLILGNFFLEMNTREQFMPTHDVLTGQGQIKRQLQPGDSASMHIQAADIVASRYRPEDYRCAAVRDGVGRVFRSSRRELGRTIAALYRRGERVG